MKTMIYLQMIVISLSMLSLACSKNDNNDKHPDEVVIQLPIMDSLNGLWNWHKTYDAKKGLIVNEYDVILKFDKVNPDSSIAYETYKNGALLKYGDIKIAYNNKGEKVIPNITPFYIPTNELYMRFISKDTIELTMNCPDCPLYYFNK